MLARSIYQFFIANLLLITQFGCSQTGETDIAIATRSTTSARDGFEAEHDRELDQKIRLVQFAPQATEKTANPIENVAPPTVYWTDGNMHQICRSIEKKSSPIIKTGLQSPRGIAVDEAAKKIYWSDYGTSKIHRANLDGSEREVVVDAPGVRGIAIDQKKSRIYWVERESKRIRCSNLDGSNVQQVITGGYEYLYGILFDADSEDLFYEDFISGKIYRCSPTEKEPKLLVTRKGNGNSGIAVHAKHLFYTDVEGGSYQVRKMDLETKQSRVIMKAPFLVSALHFDKKNELLYFVRIITPNQIELRRCKPDGEHDHLVLNLTQASRYIAMLTEKPK